MSEKRDDVVRFQSIKTVMDIHCLIRSATLILKLTRQQTGLRKRLDELLAEKGGEYRLRSALRDLGEFAFELWRLPCKVEATFTGGEDIP